jgi:hypothetical protein
MRDGRERLETLRDGKGRYGHDDVTMTEFW